MGRPRTYSDFPESTIVNRILFALRELPIAEQIKLEEEKKIVPAWNAVFPAALTYRDLSWEHIDAYAEACGVSSSYFIFGGNPPEQTYYSYYDDVVLPLLELIPPELLTTVTETVRISFDSPKLRIPLYNPPSAKFLSYILLCKKYPKPVEENEKWRYSQDLNPEIERFHKYRQKERFAFHMDYILDLCIYWKMSPHFIFSLTEPLLCKTAEADAFFDLYCLLDRTQQVSVLSMLTYLCPDAQTRLPEDTWNRIQDILAREGGSI